LFKHNVEKEAQVSEIIDRLKLAIQNSDRRVYIKITGGEPFLKLDLLEAIIDCCNNHKERIYKIGIGSNGSIPVPEFFNKLKIKTHIFLSRHSFSGTSPKELTRFNNPLIDFRLNCNLIRGGVDDTEKIKKHIAHYFKQGITHFCFRELNSISIDNASMYPKYIYDYIDYYKKNHLSIKEIVKSLSPEFVMSRKTGNFYDYNEWYWYGDISVKFRNIDERKLINYNKKMSGVDEYVIHPDGTLTGCWDKNIKLIKGGTDAK
jgi:hypothetical protein